MATIIILLSGILGFVTAITAYAGFDASLVTALMIWGLSGPLSALLVILVSLRSRVPRAEVGRAQVAELA